MTILVKTVTRLTVGFILLYGIYIGLSGRMSPGGGFAGGIIVALSFIHIMLAFGKEIALERLGANLIRFTISLSAVIFLCAVTICSRGGPPVFHNELILPIFEMAVVGPGLFAIFVALVLLGKQDKDSE